MAFQSPNQVFALCPVQREALHNLLVFETHPARCALSVGYKCLKIMLGKTFFAPDIKGGHLVALFRMVNRVTMTQGVGPIAVENFEFVAECIPWTSLTFEHYSSII